MSKKKKYKLKKYYKSEEGGDSVGFVKMIKSGYASFFDKKKKEGEKILEETGSAPFTGKAHGEISTISSYGNYFSGSYRACHSGTIEVFTDPISGIKIKAGGDIRGVESSENDLLIDCGAGFRLCKKVKENKNPIIIIHITNGSVPKMVLKFWEDLVDIIRDQKRDTLIACVGGHGRTGICLSILAYLMDIPEAKENPIEYVRKHYCKKAVETTIQFEYVKNILKLDIEKPSPHHENNSCYSDPPYPFSGGVYG